MQTCVRAFHATVTVFIPPFLPARAAAACCASWAASPDASKALCKARTSATASPIDRVRHHGLNRFLTVDNGCSGNMWEYYVKKYLINLQLNFLIFKGFVTEVTTQLTNLRTHGIGDVMAKLRVFLQPLSINGMTR